MSYKGHYRVFTSAKPFGANQGFYSPARRAPAFHVQWAAVSS